MAQSMMLTLPVSPILTSTATKAFAYGSSEPLSLAGVFTADVAHGSHVIRTRIYVTPGGHGMLLSSRTSESLQLVAFALSVHQWNVEELLAQFSSLFDGIGCLKDRMIKLHIDDSVQPVALRHRSVAFHLQPKVEAELVKLELADIIERVDGPTPWVSPYCGDS